MARHSTRLSAPLTRSPRRRRRDQTRSAAARIAATLGTGRFVVVLTALCAAWILFNILAPPEAAFDPYTNDSGQHFTLLTLALSLQVSYAAPLILLAQTAAANRDRIYQEESNRRQHVLAADVNFLTREIADAKEITSSALNREFTRKALVDFKRGLEPRRSPQP